MGVGFKALLLAVLVTSWNSQSKDSLVSELTTEEDRVYSAFRTALISVSSGMHGYTLDPQTATIPPEQRQDKCLDGIDLDFSSVEKKRFGVFRARLVLGLDAQSDVASFKRVSVSTVVFSKDKLWAVVYYDAVCGVGCGAREVVVFKKTNEDWVRATRQCKISFPVIHYSTR